MQARPTACDGFSLGVRRTLLTAFLGAVISLTYTGTATAATALVGPSSAFPGQNVVSYVADAGEVNSVTMTLVFSPPSFAFEIVDTGATISVGSGCTSLAPNRARCSYAGFLEVELGDGNDAVSLSDEGQGDGAAFHGGGGDDTIVGGGGEDSSERLFGGPGDDILKGRDGNDLLQGGLGADILSGGSSVSCGTAGVCYPDIDTVTYATRLNDVFADADGIADDGEALEGDLIRRDIEHLVGGSGDDVLAGTITRGGSIEGIPFLLGTHLEGRSGNDVLRGGRARDRLAGGSGNDVLQGSRGPDYILGDRGNDRLIGGRGPDSIVGYRGDDLLIGGRGRDQLRGGRGQDRLLARDGRADRVNGGRGADEARIDRALDHVRRVETILP